MLRGEATQQSESGAGEDWSPAGREPLLPPSSTVTRHAPPASQSRGPGDGGPEQESPAEIVPSRAGLLFDPNHRDQREGQPEVGRMTRLHGLSRGTAVKNKTKTAVLGKKKFI